MTTATTTRPPRDRGLAGLFGHRLAEDGYAENQFRIVRRAEPGRWLVEFFSWLDGSPTTVGVLEEAVLLSDRCRLYLSAAKMQHAYEYGGLARPWSLTLARAREETVVPIGEGRTA